MHSNELLGGRLNFKSASLVILRSGSNVYRLLTQNLFETRSSFYYHSTKLCFSSAQSARDEHCQAIELCRCRETFGVLPLLVCVINFIAATDRNE
jgi:hypothetical protein